MLTKKQAAEYAFDLQVGLEGSDVPEYDAATDIGQAAVLAVNLRGLGEVDYGTLRLVASRYFHIRSGVLDRILRILANLELVSLITQGHTISKVVPNVPHFEDIYERVGEFLDQAPLNELEVATIGILDRLSKSPENRDSVRSSLGLDGNAFNSALQIGESSGLIVDHRARGRDILASPLYFDGNMSGLIDMAARGDTPNVQHVLQAIQDNQGMPLSAIVSTGRVSTTQLTPDQVDLVKALASEGIIKPPSIKRPNGESEQFIFTPAPGKTRLSAANREIYEKGMALAAAVRKGQLLPERFRIKYPDALLSKLENNKFINASSEAAHQYANLSVLGLGRLKLTSGDRFQFHLIDVPENVQAVSIARTLLASQRPSDLEQDGQARLLLRSDEEYVRSHLSARKSRANPGKSVVSKRAEAEVQQFLLQL
ncbi:hypothetical protein SH203_00123 [Brevundimonas sp. SH203]|uniref:hypothetical protein n=1 Tax=Brevundimonas sp. SH203 TaxID=345167 RepID=UPI0009CD9804|nr:hypothetical protein [Brevundimonas sp. SH203]GAW39745.1 hypothetical protein SH203_00123 [Brevundimonas sp. SH203]